MIYLGSLVHEDGKCTLKVSRRIGMCKGIFQKLSHFWTHCNVGLSRKLEVFQSLIISKLVYGLASMWLGIAEQRRVDAFQNYGLRRILKIAPAYVSRISNAEVLRKKGQTALSAIILQSQLRLFSEIVQSPVSDPLRAATFHGESVTPITNAFVRKQGRPRHTWTEQLLDIAAKAAGGQYKLEQLMRSSLFWHTLTR